MFPTEYIMVIALNIFAILAAHVWELYLLIRLRNKARDAAVSVQKLLKLLITDDKPLCLSQGCLACVFPVNQQALKDLKTRTRRSVHPWLPCTNIFIYLFFHFYLPADRINQIDLLCHVFVIVEDVDDRVDFQCHFILLAPAADLEEVVKVALPALSSANQLVGCFIKAVTGDS